MTPIPRLNLLLACCCAGLGIAVALLPGLYARIALVEYGQQIASFGAYLPAPTEFLFAERWVPLAFAALPVLFAGAAAAAPTRSIAVGCFGAAVLAAAAAAVMATWAFCLPISAPFRNGTVIEVLGACAQYLQQR